MESLGLGRGKYNGLRALSKWKGFFSDFPNAALLSYYCSLVLSALRKPGPLCLLKWGNLAVMVEQ